MTLNIDTALADLRGHTDSMRLAPARLLADVILYSLCIDVLEHSEVVAMVSVSRFARAASANARAALESAIDATYLTRDRHDYSARGARARVAELFEAEEIERRSPPSTSKREERSPVSAEEIIITDARSFDELAEGSGRPLRGAWELFTKTLGASRAHWSGLTKEELFRMVFGTDEEGTPLGEMAGSLHAILSTSSHPRPRIGARELRQEDDGMLTIYTRHEEARFARNVAALACTMASTAMARRMLFDAPDV